LSKEKASSVLYVKSQEEYGQKYNDHVLEMYKLYVTMADNVSSRRQSANSFFLTVNTALVAIWGSAKHFIGEEALSVIWLLAICGIVLCFAWYRLVRSYKDLNSAKFKVIHLIEQQLPLSPYDAEWESVGRGKNKKIYLPFTYIEIFVPWIFIFIHALAIFMTCPWLKIVKSLLK
jgi:hypothetical protein